MADSHSQGLFSSSGDGTGAGPAEVIQHEHDILSFLSLFVSIVRKMSTDLFLSSVVLGPTLDIQDPVAKGNFFSITLMEAKELVRNLLVSPSNLSPLPPVIALKTPLLKGDANSPSNRRVFTSMATELQILRDDDIYNHQNIVTLLGVCWQADPDQRILPVFVMEATEIGNLETFLSQRTLGLAEQISLCIDIATGVSTIHDKGIIHGDIKPGNVLIFESSPSSFVAKICDFGSSILEATAGPTCVLKGGTKVWQAPEIHDASGPEPLRRADIYSLGLVLWYIFSLDAATAILDCDPASLFETKASGEFLETVIATLETEDEDSSQSCDPDISQLQQCILGSTLACTPAERWDMDAVVNCLFEIADLMIDTINLSDVNSEEERDIAVNLQNKISTRRMRSETSKPSHIQDQQSEDGILKVGSVLSHRNLLLFSLIPTN
jgi:serine/threonine protein kinase